MDFDALPRLDIVWPSGLVDELARGEYASARIREFAAASPGPFQVWYPDTTSGDFDVLHVVDGEIRTVPGQIDATARDRLRAAGVEL